MNPRYRAPFAVLVAAVGLAGCSALPFDSGPESPSTGTTFEPDANLAPGLTGSGVEDAEHLAFAHETSLQGESYTYVETRTVTAGNGTVLGERRHVVEVGPEGRRFNSTRTADGVDRRWNEQLPYWATYSNSSVNYVKTASGEPDERRVSRSSGRAFLRNQFALRTYYESALNGTDTEVTGTVERGGGTLYRVEGRSGSTTVRFDATEVTVTNVTVTALVDSSGLIREFTHEYDFTYEGRTGHWKRTVTYEDVGTTTVTRPGWAEGATGTTGEAERTTDGSSES